MRVKYEIYLFLFISSLGFAQTEDSIVQKTIICYGSIIDVKPEFPGGIQNLTQFFKSNLKPKKRFAGKTIEIEFTILEDGKIKNLKISDNNSKISEKQTKKLIEKMPKWRPKFLNNSAVKSIYSLEIKF